MNLKNIKIGETVKADHASDLKTMIQELEPVMKTLKRYYTLAGIIKHPRAKKLQKEFLALETDLGGVVKTMKTMQKHKQ